MLQRPRACRRAALWILAAFVAAGCVTRRVPAAIYPVVPLRTEALPEATGATDADRFGALFCGVLHYHRPDPGQWSYCEQYFKPTGTALRPSEDIPFISAYRVLVVPGIFGQCVETYARPFGDAIDHLAATHKVPVEYLSVTAMGSSGYNARQIAEYLDRQFAGSDKRPYIVVGYSKGAPDALEALAQFPAAQREIAAIVTIAGAVLGSRLSEGVPPGEGFQRGPQQSNGHLGLRGAPARREREEGGRPGRRDVAGSGRGAEEVGGSGCGRDGEPRSARRGAGNAEPAAGRWRRSCIRAPAVPGKCAYWQVKHARG